MSDPVVLFSFTDWQTSHPKDPPPGDRLDAQFNEHRVAINDVESKLNDIRRADGKLVNGIVTQDALDPSAFDAIEASIIAAATPLVTSAGGSSLAAQASASAASVSAAGAESARLEAVAAAAILASDSSGALAQIAAAKAAAEALALEANAKAADVVNDANDAEYWGNYSYSWGQVSWRWAEYMEGPIPADILAIMGISGDHWSARFWATAAANSASGAGSSASDAAAQAAAAAAAAAAAEAAAEDAVDTMEEFQNTYYGGHPSAPTSSPTGGPLTEGAMYFNTTTDQLFVYGNGTWNPVTTPSGSGVSAVDVVFAPAGNIGAINVQTAIQELDTEKVPEAPSDGGTYGRRNAAWVSVTSPTIDWGDITGIPATFPPSPHSHPISDVTGLQTALDGRATDAELAAEVTARTNADSTLQGNINAVDSALTAETGARTSADTALDGRLDVVETALPTKIGEAPNDGKQYARKSLAWAEIIGGASINLGPPSTPSPGQLWWDSDTGKFYIFYDDGNSSQWVQVNAMPNMAGLVQKAGDTMTGNLAVDPATGTAQISIDKTEGVAAQLRFSKGNLGRWVVFADTSAEAGAEVGSDFAIGRYNDAGTYLGPVLNANRKTGLISAELVMPIGFAHRQGAGTVSLGTSVWTKINMGSLGYNIPSGWSISGNSLVVPRTGHYNITASVSINTPASACVILAGFGINNVLAPLSSARIAQQVANNANWTMNTSRPVLMTAGQSIELLGFCSIAGAAVVDASDGTYITAHMVAAA